MGGEKRWISMEKYQISRGTGFSEKAGKAVEIKEIKTRRVGFSKH